MKKLLLLATLAIATILPSCISITSFKTTVALPAKPLPANIKSLLVVNRTRPMPELFDNIKVIKNGVEFGYEDRPGITDCLSEFHRVIKSGELFQTQSPTERLRANQSDQFPILLPKIEIQKNCSDYHADALVTLEIFDVKTKFDSQEQVKTNAFTNNAPQNVFTVTETITVVAGWRIYDAKQGALLDEFKTNKDFQYNADGYDLESARAALPAFNILMQKVGTEMGLAFAARISPVKKLITRYYYGKNNAEFKRARKHIKEGDWEAAKKIWEKKSKNSKGKTAGQANYNLAIYYEKSGDIKKAMEMANKAYVESNEPYSYYLLTEYNEPIQK